MKREWVLFILIFLNLVVWGLVFYSPANVLTVVFLDVGQGDAIYIEAPNGNQVLIDGGRNRGVLRTLGEVMPWDDKTLDVIIATHPDADHIGGLPAVLERYEVAAVLEPGSTASTQIYKSLEVDIDLEKKGGAKHILARRNMVINLSQNVTLDILYPDGNKVGADTNSSSVVARLTDGYHSFLLTGDSPLAVEDYLLSLNKGELDVEVLKVGHHGSRTSTGLGFLSATTPDYAIISAGANNNYGHPHAEIVNRLMMAGVNILETSKEGTIICESSATMLKCR